MSSLYRICQQYGIPDEHRQPLIDAYIKFVVAGLSPDFDALINLLSPYIFGGTVEGLTEGRIVHFVLQTGPSHGQHRPAMVVKVWNKDSGSVNLTVFADWENDGVADSAYWATSVRYSENHEPGTWHWIEKA